MKPAILLSLAALLLSGAPPANAVEPRVIRLSGTPYALGRQHGEALREEVRASVEQVLGYFRRQGKIPWLRTALVNGWLDWPRHRSRPYVPPAYLEEMRGLADGAGIPLAEIERLHAVPDRTYTCANFAAWGRATVDGRLIHARNLDWSIDAGLQQRPVVFVVRPDGKRAFVSAGWAGFLGVLTGVNDAQISIGEVGAETTEVRDDGIPMVLLMRRVMEEAGGVEDAVAILRSARRTVGVNYVIADAKVPEAVAVETTAVQLRVFRADDPAEHEVIYARPVADAVFRADTAIDPGIRNCQLASGGHPKAPGLELPTGSAYEKRYLGQAAGLSRAHGTMDLNGAQALASEIAPDSNVQSVLIAWPELRLANADGRTPAAKTPYHQYNLVRLLSEAP